jgi:transcriptional regulator with XRE-family HTH domain
LSGPDTLKPDTDMPPRIGYDGGGMDTMDTEAGPDTPGERVRQLRLARGWSLQQLADRIGASKPQIDKLERGTRRLTQDWGTRLAAAFDVPETDFLSGGGPSPVPSAGRIRTSGALDTIVSKASGNPDTKMDTKSDTAPSLDTNQRDLDSPDTSLPTEDAWLEALGPGGREAVGDLPLCGFGRYDPREGRHVGVIVGRRDAPERVWRPAPLAGVSGAYAVRMPDASMLPKYQPGQLLFVHPFRTPGAGDAVVVRLRGGRFLVGRLCAGDPGGMAIERAADGRRQHLDARTVLAVERIVLSEEP